jgi:MmyB-like transcription regulator ligand binding domain
LAYQRSSRGGRSTSSRQTRSLLLDPEEQAFHADWAASSAGFIAAFRESIGDDINDPRFVECVDELSLGSGRFRELWARHDVWTLEGDTATVNHPVVGELHLHRDKLPVEGLFLVLYYADVGSESAEKLALLASLIEPSTAGGHPPSLGRSD